jgi:hypothetical protein
MIDPAEPSISSHHDPWRPSSPNSDLYFPSQPSCVTLLPAAPPLLQPPAMGFPTSTSPLGAAEMLGGDGERVESSDDDGDDGNDGDDEDDEDEDDDDDDDEGDKDN